MRLSRRPPPNQSREDQWYSIFYILFDASVERPQSPYLNIDRVLYHGALSLQEYIEGEGVLILDNVLTESHGVTWNLPFGEHDRQTFRHHILLKALRTMFEQWEAQQGSPAPIPPRPATGDRGQNSSGILPATNAAPSSTGAQAGSILNPGPPLQHPAVDPQPTFMLPHHPSNAPALEYAAPDPRPGAPFDFMGSDQAFGFDFMINDVDQILQMTNLDLENGRIPMLDEYDGSESWYTGTSASDAGRNRNGGY